LKLGQVCLTFICAKPLCWIQSIIAFFNQGKSLSLAEIFNLQPADSVNFNGSNGDIVFQSGVDFVFIFFGVVGEA
jgi:hypothetical protein